MPDFRKYDPNDVNHRRYERIREPGEVEEKTAPAYRTAPNDPYIQELRHTVEVYAKRVDEAETALVVVRKERDELREELHNVVRKITELDKSLNYWRERAFAAERIGSLCAGDDCL